MTSFVFRDRRASTRRTEFWNNLLSLLNIPSERTHFVIVWQRLRRQQVHFSLWKSVSAIFFGSLTSIHLAFLWKLASLILRSPFSRVHGPFDLHPRASDSFINASLILTVKRLVRPSIPREYTTLSSFPIFSPFVLLSSSLAFRYPAGSLLKCCSLFTQHIYTHTHTCTRTSGSFRQLFRLLC